MSVWRHLASQAKGASCLTAALITLTFSAPIAVNLVKLHHANADQLKERSTLRAEEVATNVSHALDQTITATAVLADGFDQGNPELLSRTSSNILRIIGSSAQLEVKPEGSPVILIRENNAPPGRLANPAPGLAGTWKAPVPLGAPSVSLHNQQLSITQTMVNRSPEGRTRFWGYVTISQPFSSLVRTAQLNQLAAGELSIRVKYHVPGQTTDTLLFDSFPAGASALASKSIRLPGSAQLQFEIAPLAANSAFSGDWLYLLVASLALFSLTLLVLKRPAALQHKLGVANQLLEDEKQALQREISERLEAEKMLERSHRLLDSIFEHIPGMIVLKRASDRRIVRINRSGEEILSRGRHTLIGRCNDEIYEAHLASRLNHSDEQLLTDCTAIQLPIEQITMPGQAPRWVSLRKTALLGEGGRPEYILEFGQDVTEQEQLDLRLREHLHFLEQLIDAIPSPLFFKDTKGRYISVNNAFERYIGISRTELTGKTIFDISSPALARLYNRADMDLLATGGTQSYESTVKDADGKARDVLFHKAVFHQTDGDKGGIVGILLDITERKNAEQQVNRLNRFLTVLSDVNQAIVRIQNAELLLTQVAELLCSSANFPVSWIELNAGKRLLTCAECCSEQPLIRKILREIESTASFARDLPHYGKIAEQLGIELQDELGERSLASFAILPIRQKNAPVGSVGILESHESGLSGQERQLLEDLANNVSQALERIDAEAQKHSAAEQLELAARVFENSAEGIIITDTRNRILLVNKTFATVTGYAPAEVIGRNPSLLSSGRREASFYQTMWEVLHATGEWHGEIENRRKNGELYPEWLNISVVRQPDGTISNYVAVFSDLTNRKEIEKRVLFLSQFDTLTALPNRSHFHDQLAHATVQAGSHHTRLALITLDIDRFKLFNDSLGHSAGDRILVEVASRLKGCITPGDKLCRLGGDEFAIIINHVNGNEDAAAVAVNIQTRLRKSIHIEGHEIHLSASIGIAVYPDDAPAVEGLVSCADAAMYAAIEQGGNAFRFFQQEMNIRSAERMRIEARLHHALERGELSVFFQPLVNAKNGRIAGAEALLRWHNDELGAVSPTVFVPLLEDTQLICTVGKWVLRKACIENKRWRAHTGSDLFVAVNLSAVQLADDNLVNDIREILAETGFDPRYLEIELTESSIMHDSELGMRTLNRLKDLGIRLSIDDFGTGYSSLSYLNQFPLDTLKIDRSFVMNAAVDDNSQAIIKAIVAMGHTLGFEIIAEGVEDLAQLNLLRDNTVDILQGYYFSRPVPATEFEELLRRTPIYPLPEREAPALVDRLIPLARRRR